MGMNRNLVGREYPETRYRVEPKATQAYARAINEDNPVFFWPGLAGEMLAPPLFPVVYHPRALGQVLGDPELGFDGRRALHGEQDMHFHRPIRPGDVIATSVRIEAIEEEAHAEMLCLELASRDQQGRPLETTRSTLAVHRPRAEGSSAPPARAPESVPGPTLVVTQQFDVDQGFRYAEASGDHNRIHLDEMAARRAGFPGIPGHGLCTMAFISKALVDHLAAGEPTRLARLALRFSRPVFPGQKIETRIEEAAGRGAERCFRFETRNPQGEPVIGDGVAEIRSEAIA